MSVIVWTLKKLFSVVGNVFTIFHFNIRKFGVLSANEFYSQWFVSVIWTAFIRQIRYWIFNFPYKNRKTIIEYSRSRKQKLIFFFFDFIFSFLSLENNEHHRIKRFIYVKFSMYFCDIIIAIDSRCRIRDDKVWIIECDPEIFKSYRFNFFFTSQMSSFFLDRDLKWLMDWFFQSVLGTYDQESYRYSCPDNTTLNDLSFVT